LKEGSGKILEFNSYLRGSKPILEKLGDMTQRMNELARRALEKKLVLLEFLLPDYEKHCLLENDEKRKADALLFLCASSNGITEALEKYKRLNDYPPVLLVSEEIKRERREIEAFEELLKVREELEADRLKAVGKVKDLEIEGSKINAGKESFFSKLKKVSKEEQLAANQKELERAKADEKNCACLCQIVTNLVASREIDRFKQKRQKAYFQLLKEFSRVEKTLAEGENDLWTQVGRHDLIALDEHNILLKKEEEEDKPEPLHEEETKEVAAERAGEVEIRGEDY
jgi:sorting nexin-1/2